MSGPPATGSGATILNNISTQTTDIHTAVAPSDQPTPAIPSYPPIDQASPPDRFSSTAQQRSLTDSEPKDGCTGAAPVALERQLESFDFPFMISDQSYSWDDAVGAEYDAFVFNYMPHGLVNMDILSNNVLNALADHNDTINNSVGLEQLDPFQFRALQSPTSRRSTVLSMGAISDPSMAVEFSNATFSSSSPLNHNITNSNVILDSTCFGVNMEDPHESFHEVADTRCTTVDVAANQAATRLDETEHYRRTDRLAWRKRGEAGGIKTMRQPRQISTSLSPVTRPHAAGGPLKDMDAYGNRVRFRLKTSNVTLDDGFVWFKYGQKNILKHKHPRSYLKCAESTRSGCKVLKRVQRCSDDEDYVEFLYLGRHNHG